MRPGTGLPPPQPPGCAATLLFVKQLWRRGSSEQPGSGNSPGLVEDARSTDGSRPAGSGMAEERAYLRRYLSSILSGPNPKLAQLYRLHTVANSVSDALPGRRDGPERSNIDLPGGAGRSADGRGRSGEHYGGTREPPGGSGP